MKYRAAPFTNQLLANQDHWLSWHVGNEKQSWNDKFLWKSLDLLQSSWGFNDDFSCCYLGTYQSEIPGKVCYSAHSELPSLPSKFLLEPRGNHLCLCKTLIHYDGLKETEKAQSFLSPELLSVNRLDGVFASYGWWLSIFKNIKSFFFR